MGDLLRRRSGPAPLQWVGPNVISCRKICTSTLLQHCILKVQFSISHHLAQPNWLASTYLNQSGISVIVFPQRVVLKQMIKCTEPTL